MPPDERRERMNAHVRRRVRRDDAVAWSERFLSSLRAMTAAGSAGCGHRALRAPIPAGLVARVRGERPSGSLLLDYDGTLVPLTQRPGGRRAGPEPVLDLLRRLAVSARARPVAVLSGRPRQRHRTLVRRTIPRLWLAAEHGALLRAPGAEEWRAAAERRRHRVERACPAPARAILAKRARVSFDRGEGVLARRGTTGSADPEFGGLDRRTSSSTTLGPACSRGPS